MKSTLYLNSFLLTALLFISVSCHKENMPDEHKDWNVLEWTVDGERYKADCEGDPLFGCDPVDCQYYHDTRTLEFYGSSLKYGAIEVYKYKNLFINDNNNFLSKYDIYNFYGNSSDCNTYQADTNQNYLLKINSIDTLNNTIEGQFEFIGINGCQDTVQVEDGYFKLSYRP